MKVVVVCQVVHCIRSVVGILKPTVCCFINQTVLCFCIVPAMTFWKCISWSAKESVVRKIPRGLLSENEILPQSYVHLPEFACLCKLQLDIIYWILARILLKRENKNPYRERKGATSDNAELDLFKFLGFENL